MAIQDDTAVTWKGSPINIIVDGVSKAKLNSGEAGYLDLSLVKYLGDGGILESTNPIGVAMYDFAGVGWMCGEYIYTEAAYPVLNTASLDDQYGIPSSEFLRPPTRGSYQTWFRIYMVPTENETSFFLDGEQADIKLLDGTSVTALDEGQPGYLEFSWNAELAGVRISATSSFSAIAGGMTHFNYWAWWPAFERLYDYPLLNKVIPSIVPATVDINPDTLNLKARGVFTAYVTLPEDYSVEDVDVATVECEGAPAMRSSIEEDTLIVKFNRRIW